MTFKPTSLYYFFISSINNSPFRFKGTFCMQRLYPLFIALFFTLTCFTFLSASQKQKPKEKKMTVRQLEDHLKEDLRLPSHITHAIENTIKEFRKKNPKNIQAAYDLLLMLIKDHALASVNNKTCECPSCESKLHEEKTESFSFKSLLLCCNSCL